MTECSSPHPPYVATDLFGASEHGGGAGGAAVPGSQTGRRGRQALHGVKEVKTQHWEALVAVDQPYERVRVRKSKI